MDVSQYTHTIVKNFLTHFPIAYKSMHQVSHNEDPMFSNYHLEGSLWTHTMMVLTVMQQYAQGHPTQNELLLAALLHDVGKVYTRDVNEEKQKVTFYGHPGFSTLLARDMISKIDPTLTDEQKLYVLYLVNHHQILFNIKKGMSDKALQKIVTKFGTDYPLLRDLIAFRNADSTGRICVDADELSSTRFTGLETAVKTSYLANQPATATGKPKAVIMVGLPGSGKSTYISEFLKDYTLVSRDAQIKHLMGDMDYTDAFKLVDQGIVDTLYNQAFSTAVQKGVNLVIDKTNLTHKSRMRSIQGLTHGYDIEILVLMPSLLTVYRRNQKRKGKSIPMKVIRNMMTTFELPFKSEGEVKVLFDF